jgi:DNA polymerase III alpha subunit
VLDKTGVVGIFDDEQTSIEAGKTYIILASDNRVLSALPVEEAKGSDSGVVKFLNYKQLPYTDEEMYVLSFKPRVTKAGKKMAYMVLADTSRELHSVTVFPTQFPQAYMKVKEGNAYKFEFGKTKDGTVIMNEVK